MCPKAHQQNCLRPMDIVLGEYIVLPQICPKLQNVPSKFNQTKTQFLSVPTIDYHARQESYSLLFLRNQNEEFPKITQGTSRPLSFVLKV